MAKPKWRPRQGAKLAQPQEPGRIQRMARLFFARLPQWLLHPLWAGIVFGLIAATGHNELLLRSVGLLLAAAWLACDTWTWLLGRKTNWKFVIGWAVTNLLLIAVMSIMWWWLNGNLGDIRNDVFTKLEVAVGNETDPLRSFFTLRNGSVHALGKHSMVATPNLIVGNHGSSLMRSQNFGERIGIHFDCGEFADSLEGGGIGQTYPCLHNVTMVDGIDCVDVTINVFYVLKDQPNINQRKDFRFVSASKEGFLWHSQPPENPFNYCGSYLNEESRRQSGLTPQR